MLRHSFRKPHWNAYKLVLIFRASFYWFTCGVRMLRCYLFQALLAVNAWQETFCAGRALTYLVCCQMNRCVHVFAQKKCLGTATEQALHMVLRAWCAHTHTHKKTNKIDQTAMDISVYNIDTQTHTCTVAQCTHITREWTILSKKGRHTNTQALYWSFASISSPPVTQHRCNPVKPSSVFSLTLSSVASSATRPALLWLQGNRASTVSMYCESKHSPLPRSHYWQPCTEHSRKECKLSAKWQPFLSVLQQD